MCVYYAMCAGCRSSYCVKIICTACAVSCRVAAYTVHCVCMCMRALLTAECTPCMYALSLYDDDDARDREWPDPDVSEPTTARLVSTRVPIVSWCHVLHTAVERARG